MNNKYRHINVLHVTHTFSDEIKEREITTCVTPIFNTKLKQNRSRSEISLTRTSRTLEIKLKWKQYKNKKGKKERLRKHCYQTCRQTGSVAPGSWWTTWSWYTRHQWGWAGNCPGDPVTPDRIETIAGHCLARVVMVSESNFLTFPGINPTTLI